MRFALLIAAALLSACASPRPPRAASESPPLPHIAPPPPTIARAPSSTFSVGYTSATVIISMSDRHGLVDDINVFSVAGGSKSLLYTFVSDGTLNNVPIILSDPDAYSVQCGPTEGHIVIDKEPPVTTNPPVIRRTCKGARSLTITGMSSDDLSGVYAVNVAVAKYGSSALWFNGRSWSKTGTWLKAAGTDNWELSIPDDHRETQAGSLTMYVSAVDRALMRENPREWTLPLPPPCP